MTTKDQRMTREELEEMTARFAQSIGQVLKATMPPGVGFTLLMFDFGAQGNMAYASSASREDMIKALAEMREKLLERNV